MWMTVPSWPSGFRSSSCSRSGSTAELLFHGGGPVWRPGMLAHGMFVELVVAADEEPPLESVTPSTTPTITSTATAPPAIHQGGRPYARPARPSSGRAVRACASGAGRDLAFAESTASPSRRHKVAAQVSRLRRRVRGDSQIRWIHGFEI